MSDELDKMREQFKNLKPSQNSRDVGMSQAMAAFDAAFSENNSEVSQGLEAEDRPISQETGATPVLTLWSSLMKSVKNLFSLSPKTMMMAGSCTAALMAAVIFMPIMEFETTPPVKPAVPEPVVENPIPEQPPISGDTDRDAPKDLGALDAKKDEIRTSPQITVEAPPKVEPRVKPESNVEEVQPTAPIAATDSETRVVIKGSDASESSPQAVQDIIKNSQIETTSPIEPSSDASTPPGGNTSINDLLGNAQKDTSKTQEGNIQIESETRQKRNEANDTIIVTGSRVREMQVSNAPELSFSQPIVAEASIASDSVYIQPPQVPDRFSARNNDKFEGFEPNPITSVRETPVSTFSIDVDTASYSFLRASLNRGQVPPPESIRVEEMINYFSYDYDAPTSAKEPFKANVTVTPTPWNADTKLMHIGIKGYVPPVEEASESNIVLLIDTSGSMRAQNKLPLLISSFKLLLDTLDENDTVSIVTYAGRAGTALEPTPASEKAQIIAALENLRSGGSTAGAAGLELAYQKATESFKEGGINRVILATDGDFNVGFSSPQEMKTYISKKRQSGIFLSVLGFGQGNYNDHLMQSLAQNGNGIAAYIDTLSEANKVLANEARSALQMIAKDVKIQVEFNPATISEYRLIGYETRALNREDFNNDAVDAGDIGSGHTVTAIYELTPVGSPAQVIDDLRYASGTIDEVASDSDEYAFIKIRHKLPDSDTSRLQTFPISEAQETRFNRTDEDVRFASAVAAFGQKLRGDVHLTDYDYEEIIALAERSKGADKEGYRAEFIRLAEMAKALEQ
jgi:Ca-activated chloride channel family protein